MEILIPSLIGMLLVGAVVFYVRHRNRILWRHIRTLEKRLEQTNAEVVQCNKRIILSSVKDTRLDPLMPSQHGEDVFIWHWFNGKRNGLYLDIGAHDGVQFSNTYWLECIGWNGILVEANPELAREAEQNRPYSRVIHAAAAVGGDDDKVILHVPVGGEIGAEMLAFTQTSDYQLERVKRAGAIVKKVEVPLVHVDEVIEEMDGVIDVLTIDIEGSEKEVIKSIDYQRHAPRMIIYEDNSNGVDADIRNFLEQQKYSFVRRIGCNIVMWHTCQ